MVGWEGKGVLGSFLIVDSDTRVPETGSCSGIQGCGCCECCAREHGGCVLLLAAWAHGGLGRSAGKSRDRPGLAGRWEGEGGWTWQTKKG